MDIERNLRYKDQLCITLVDELRKEILDEAYNSTYSVHPGATKMYRDFKPLYWWPSMNKDVTVYVLKCLTCQ